MWRLMKRRAAIEPTIAHMKSEHRLERNRLKGTCGDAVNALVSGVGMNFGKLLAWVGRFWLFLRAVFWGIFSHGNPYLPFESGFFSAD
jgi:IS5 family transposase